MDLVHVIGFSIAAIAGTLVSEFIAFGEKQHIYKRGSDKTSFKESISYQLNNYLMDRFDNLLNTFFIGVGLAFILGSSINQTAITDLIINKLGFEGVTLSLSGSALCFILLAFGQLLLKKVGIIKEKKES
tara:strand:+ start:4639 stop:5028 length:390 start_codon:yes stop_codon:yes gene_type:complete